MKFVTAREDAEVEGNFFTLDLEVYSHNDHPPALTTPGRTVADLIGLVNIIVGQWAQEVL